MDGFKAEKKPDYLKNNNDDDDDVLKSIIKVIGLFVLIALAVTVGNLTSNYITSKIAEHKLAEATRAMEAELRIQDEHRRREQEQRRVESARRSELQKKHAEEARARIRKKELEERRRRAAMSEVERQLDNTCNFWIREYKKDRSELSKSHRDVACRDAGRPFK